MRPRFEKDLRSFSGVAKEELEFEKGSEADLDSEMDELSTIVDWHLEKAAERQHTSLGIQQEIYNIQKEKQEIMTRLKERLACLDHPECQSEREENERLARFNEKTSGFIYEDDEGREQSATFGELVTDIDWGVTYHIDARTAPRWMVKRYLVERAKNELRDLSDLQIIQSEAGGDIAHEQRREAYRRVEEERKSGVAEKRLGFVSETIVKNLLKKLSIDQNLPFEIREADVFQDVEQKIDFIIHRKEKLRGVNVETDEKAKDVGIQFSVYLEAAEMKRHQVERAKRELQEEGEGINDIALVIFPLTIASTLRKRWERGGRMAGGPDKFLYRHVAKKLFSELTQGIFTPEEIDTYWEKAKYKFPERN